MTVGKGFALGLLVAAAAWLVGVGWGRELSFWALFLPGAGLVAVAWVIGNWSPPDWNSGVAAIARERRRQIAKKGFTTEHDRQHGQGELADAAAVYALGAHFTDWPSAGFWADPGIFVNGPDGLVALWPWEPARLAKIAAMDRRERLAKAGALIAAELDRLEAGQ